MRFTRSLAQRAGSPGLRYSGVRDPVSLPAQQELPTLIVIEILLPPSFPSQAIGTTEQRAT